MNGTLQSRHQALPPSRHSSIGPIGRTLSASTEPPSQRNPHCMEDELFKIFRGRWRIESRGWIGQASHENASTKKKLPCSRSLDVRFFLDGCHCTSPPSSFSDRGVYPRIVNTPQVGSERSSTRHDEGPLKLRSSLPFMRASTPYPSFSSSQVLCRTELAAWRSDVPQHSRKRG